MDTLSSSVSTFKVPSLPPTNREFYHFKSTPYAATNRPQQPQAHVFSISNPNLVSKTKRFSPKNSPSLVFSSSSTSPLNSSSPIFYQKPATGYAAALIDVAQSNNSIHLVERDVQRLLKFLQKVNFQPDLVYYSSMGEELEGHAIRQMLKRGRLHKHVGGLLEMLIKKKKVGILQEVLEEFERIYDELCGTQVVLVSSATEMGEDQLFGIAKSVQQFSGAVKIKVKNLVQENLPSYAV